MWDYRVHYDLDHRSGMVVILAHSEDDACDIFKRRKPQASIRRVIRIEYLTAHAAVVRDS